MGDIEKMAVEAAEEAISVKKVAVVVGHTRNNPGASSEVVGSEFFYNSKVGEYLEDIVDVYHYDTYKGGYTNMVKRNAKKLNKHDYSLVLELHFNSAGEDAEGCEALYYRANKKGKELAELYCEIMCNTFGSENRGAKSRELDDRGGAALYYPKATTLILEPFFGSNKEDANRYKDAEKYAIALRWFIKQAV